MSTGLAASAIFRAMAIPIAVMAVLLIYVLYLRVVAPPFFRAYISTFEKNDGFLQTMASLHLGKALIQLAVTYFVTTGLIIVAVAPVLNLDSALKTAEFLYLCAGLAFAIRFFASLDFTWFAYTFYDALIFWGLLTGLTRVLFARNPFPPQVWNLDSLFVVLLLCLILTLLGELICIGVSVALCVIEVSSGPAFLVSMAKIMKKPGPIASDITGSIRQEISGD